ncbi:MAG: hypothetical protein GWN67_12025 [Phycisphaerae bacterium]|nr:DUF167 domain-containing protein [Phycisphaerae bacterium]NIP52807.1 DUF167 domain-containing protein [Phycisphaerae bacterium]NIS51823.1 DUF167 domain-containing protein [Phycisphaerae bacterium]NIU09352.1 DUF167 domain-containing protein [Phycisphaerae bacterium]NIU57076.1 hypothetical protein [Phycisphaerae bacterium]
MSNFVVKEIGDGVIFTVKAVPGSSRTAVCGLLDEMVKIKVSAAPEKGKANKCLLDFLSKKLGVKRNAVKIVSGKGNPVKSVQVMGISVVQLLNKLNLNKQSVGQ